MGLFLTPEDDDFVTAKIIDIQLRSSGVSNPRVTLDYGYYLEGKGYIPLNEINHRISEIDTALP